MPIHSWVKIIHLGCVMIYEYFITINNPSFYHHVSQEREKIFKAQWYKEAISLVDVSKSQREWL